MAARRMAIIGLLLCLCLYLLPCGAMAAGEYCSLTLAYGCDGVAFGDVPVKVYRIAVSEDSEYTLMPQFREAGVNVNGVTSTGEWNTIRTTLEAYILGENLSPDFEMLTDPDGKVCLENLEPGLYLVAAAKAVQEDLHCVFGSALVAMPDRDEEGHWQNALTVSPKPELIPPIEPDEQVQYKVLKLWKDNGNQKQRPQSITVEIFRNGISQETVPLSDENLWSYSWTAKADGSNWQVVEKNIPAGYTVTVEEQTTTFVLTNTWKEQPPKDNPQTGDNTRLFDYLTLMILSAVGLALVAVAGKRKHL